MEIYIGLNPLSTPIVDNGSEEMDSHQNQANL
jgi:hypothetical protein